MMRAGPGRAGPWRRPDERANERRVWQNVSNSALVADSGPRDLSEPGSSGAVVAVEWQGSPCKGCGPARRQVWLLDERARVDAATSGCVSAATSRGLHMIRVLVARAAPLARVAWRRPDLRRKVLLRICAARLDEMLSRFGAVQAGGRAGSERSLASSRLGQQLFNSSGSALEAQREVCPQLARLGGGATQIQSPALARIAAAAAAEMWRPSPCRRR